MKRKSILSGIILSLAANMLPGGIVHAADGAETKTELVNVAMFKPVTVSQGPVDSAKQSLVDDHNNTDLIISYANGAQWAMVDLQRRYKIERIEVSARSGSSDSIWLSNFEIQASNSSDFSEYTVLDSLSSGEGEALPVLGNSNQVFNIEDIRPYRYVRLYSTHMSGYSELRVYAEQTVTQIMPEAAAAGEVYDNNQSYAAGKAIDNNNSTQWIGTYASNYNFLRIDLGKQYNIGYVEVSGSNTEIGTRTYFSVYGANDLSQLSDADNLKKSTLTSYGYTKLAYLRNPAGEKPAFQYNPYPEGGTYKATVDETAPFRYMTLKKDDKNHIRVSEFKAYVVNPVINTLTINDDILNIEFSDEMDTATFSGISLLNSGTNETVSLSNWSAADDYTYTADISALEKDTGYTVVLDNVKNKKGVSAVGTKSFDLLNDLQILQFECKDSTGNPFTELTDVTAPGAIAQVSNVSQESKNVFLATALYEDNRLTSVDVKTQDVASGESVTLSSYVDRPQTSYPGRKFKAFLWDNTGNIMMPITGCIEMTEKQMNDFYVSAAAQPGGYGSASSPFSTIEEAKSAVRTVNSDMTQDINIHILPGTYCLDEPLVFTDADSGSNGFNINYIAEGGNAVISGGEKISGWQKVNGNLYKAPYSGKSKVGELYVNGIKAVRASKKEPVTPKGLYYSDAEKTQISGIELNADDVKNLSNAEDVQIRYLRGWRSILCNVDELIAVDDTTAAFKMGDGFINEVSTSKQHKVEDTSPFYIENVFSELDEPNEFYYNKPEGYIYYMCDDGTDMNAADVYAPALEQLVKVEGTNLNRKAKNIVFDGLTFAHAAWNYPMENDFIGGQSQGFAGGTKLSACDILGKDMIDAAVSIDAAENIKFINGNFVGIAKNAVGLYNGASNNTIEGNAFYNLGSSAVTVGLPTDNYMEPDYDGYNLAFNKYCTSSNTSNTYPAYNATDGSAAIGWSAESVNGSYANAWWQVDLGDAYEIDRIEIDARSNQDQETTRRYFEILASNDPEFKDGGKQIAVCTTGFGDKETWKADVSDNEKYRYVRLRKTNNEYMYLAEIRVINTSMEHIPFKEVCKNNNIYNNCITAVGELNYGAPAIQTYYTENVDIAHNYIYNVPYSGIAVGWGWTTYPDSVTSKNNKVRNNIIENFALTMMDGGGIYILAQQPGSEISGNYIKNQQNVFGAIYPDNGSDSYAINNNITENVWMSLFISTADKKNLTGSNNWTTNSVMQNYGTNCNIDSLQYYVPGNMPAEAQAIADNAGLTEEYSAVKDRVNVIPHEYTDAEKYFNVVNGQTSISDGNFIYHYLRNVIDGAKTILQTAQSGAYAQEKLNALSQACVAADAKYNEFKSSVDSGKAIDRNAVLEVKSGIENAVDVFLK